MATLGKTTAGASTRALDGNCRGLRVTMPEAAQSGFSVWAYISDTATGDSFRAALIQDADKETTLASSNIRTDISTAGWYQFSGGTFDTYEPANAETFIIVVGSNSAAGGLMYYDAHTTFSGYASGGALTSIDPFDVAPGGAVLAADTARDYSVYLEYTAASAGGRPSHFMGFGGRMIG